MFFRFIKSFRNRHVMAVDLVLILIVVNLAFLTRFEQSYLYYKFIPVMRRMMAVSFSIRSSSAFWTSWDMASTTSWCRRS